MFLELRKKLINWLAGEDICVIVNCHMYDQLLDVNEMVYDNHVIRGNKIFNLEERLKKEVAIRINLAKQGISKQGKAFVLKEVI
jgi:hypothetical protein